MTPIPDYWRGTAETLERHRPRARADARAKNRLVALHREEFDRIRDEERQKLGMSKVTR